MRRHPDPVNPWVLALVVIALLGSGLILQRALEAEGRLNTQPRGASR